MKSRVPKAVLLVVAAALAGPALLAGEPGGPAEPAKPAPKPAGVIKGKLTPPERVLGAYLWDRGSDVKVPLRVDPKTGAFEARDLRLGTYDLVVHAPWGRLEGIDMAPRLTDYDALIPPEHRTEDLGLETGGKLTEDDVQAIRRHIHEVKRHENRIRDLYVAGTHDRAVALVELVLDRDFVGRQGDEIVWRMEQWYYENKYDAWTQFRTRVLYRHRVSKKVWASWGWQFEPRLGGLTIADDRPGPIVVEYEVPEKPAPEKGLAGDRTPPGPGRSASSFTARGAEES